MKTRIEVELGGRNYRLLPGPGALKRISLEVGDPLQIAQAAQLSGLQNRPPPLKTVIDVFFVAFAESGHEITKDDLWDLVYEEGAAQEKFFVAFVQFLMALVHSGELPKADEDDESEGAGEPEEPQPRNRKERRTKKAKARAATGKRSKA